MTDLEELKHHIRTEWAKLDHAVIASVAPSSLSVRQGWWLSRRALFLILTAITMTFLAVVDQSNSCMPICRFGLIAVVSYDFVLSNTWQLSNSQVQ